MLSHVWKGILVTVLAISPQAARGQCMGGSSGSHDHGGDTGVREDRSEKKTRQSIRRVMSDERSREVLMEEIFSDPDFVRSLIARIGEVPEWRALAAQSLGPGVAKPVTVGPDSAAGVRTSPAPGAPSALYVCPMHSDVSSPGPGKCPRCGMTLERRT
jgi:hypothetical protein